MRKDLPIYELKIDGENTFVNAVALVENPAIEIDFLAFNEDKPMQFEADEEKMELLGVAMVPNQLIYRRDKTGYEYQVYFSKDTIRSITQKFFLNKFQTNINLEHSEASADTYIYQAMIADHSKKIFLMDAPDGSVVFGMKVLNPNVFKQVKDGTFKGFSIEGMFELVEQQFSKQQNADERECIELLKQIQSKLNNHI
ncbi:MAG: XkdF-like putative serine protease domain-containing protein [Ferruginibacter sp.]